VDEPGRVENGVEKKENPSGAVKLPENWDDEEEIASFRSWMRNICEQTLSLSLGFLI